MLCETLRGRRHAQLGRHRGARCRRGAAFYGPVLGWTFVDTGEEFGHYQMCRVGDQNAAGIGPKQDPEQTTAWLLYLASDDADGTAKLITDNGGGLIWGPEDIGEIGRMAVATDSTAVCSASGRPRTR